jgi:DNA polymerase-1
VKTLLLIDANSIIHRSFHALPPLTTQGSKPIQAVYGLASILLKLWREERPDYAAALFDRPEPTLREKKYAEYKAQRPATPDELISQLTEAHNLFSEFGVKTFEVVGHEADDLIATLAEKFRGEADLKMVILTGDLDTLQLVEDGKIYVRTFKKGVSDTMVYDEKAVEERYGLKPEQLVDYKALVGDQSDNIKGVPGVGPKTASDALKQFGNLDSVYKNLGKDPKLEKKLAPFRKEAELARQLVTLERNAPLGIENLQELKIKDKTPEIKAYFAKLGFETLIKRLEEGVAVARKETRKQGQIFFNNRLSVKKAAKFGRSDAVFVSGSFGAEYSHEFASEKPKVGFGLKAFLKELWKKKKDLAPPYFDLGVAFWLLDPDFKDYEPKAVFRKFLNKEWSGEISDLSHAFDFAREKLNEYKLEKIFNDVEMPLLRILAEMENTGVCVSGEKLGRLETEIDKNISVIAKEIYSLAGEEFNINSPQKVSEILFGKLAITPTSDAKTKTGLRSTRAGNLEELRGANKIVDSILNYRESFKILSTYVRPLREILGPDGRVRTEFVQTGTATGRLSSKSPNLQNIPQESIWAEDLRSAFVAPKGFSLLALDYSQLELRILAALSGDEKMIEAFRKGLDIHKVTAARVFGVPLLDVKPEERRLAKTLNFGLIYGMGAAAFARASGLSRERAREFIAAYFKEFRGVKGWQEGIKSEARERGYTETLLGRRRYLFGIVADSQQIVAEAERAAINHPVQGLGADFIKMSMIKSKEKLEETGSWNKNAKMILSIHDELLFEVRDDMMEKTARLIKEIMEGIYDLPVPLEVEVYSGKDWGHTKKLKFKT